LSAMYFLPNSLSDPSFEAYLRDTHRLMDYRDVKDDLLPKLVASFEEFASHHQIKFICSNRFEGQFPAMRIQCPVGFVPDLIYIEFPHRHESFLIKQAAQETAIQGLVNLAIHLRVILTMGLAHWRPN
jgi:hypothetical protein